MRVVSRLAGDEDISPVTVAAAAQQLLHGLVVAVRVDPDIAPPVAARQLLNAFNKVARHAAAAVLLGYRAAVHDAVGRVGAPLAVGDVGIGRLLAVGEHEEARKVAAVHELIQLAALDVALEGRPVGVIALPLVDVQRPERPARVGDDLHNAVDVLFFRRDALKLFRELYAPVAALYVLHKLSVRLVLRLEFFVHIRSFLLCSLKLLPPPPQLYPAVISVQQHLRHGAPLPDLRARILRVLQQPVPVALAGVALLIGKHSRHKAAHRIGHGHRRDLAAGEKKLMGEFLVNAQGEDVVAGVRTPMPIAQMAEQFPEAYADFVKVCGILEEHYRDMQDMEFTVENGKLYMLQCRNGKRTAQAALKIACDLVDEGMIDEKKAVLMIDPRNLDTLLHPQFDTAALKAATPIGKGLGASPGAACGKIVFSAEEAKEWAARKEKVVLVRLETSPEDIEGMKAAQGILTVRGGMTSHAAVVARGMGKCCVSGCGAIAMDEANKKFTLAGKTYHEGDYISIDGSTGNIYDGLIPTVDATIAGEFGRIMGWADKYRRLQVRTNADTPHDARKARELGAQGIGLTRTEHMFFNSDRIAAFREMICSDTKEERVAALAKLEPMQQEDFEGIYEAMGGYPVTIRFLDPPLHEFVPTEEADIEALAKTQGKTVEQIKNIIASLHEFNPMMGHRGCRLAVTCPEIAEMQTRAVIKAALAVQARHPEWKLAPEIMIPLVGEVKELKYVKDVVTAVADKLIADAGSDMKYLVGTMIEIPRAALTADQIATEAQFFSFGTNDLTQMTFGFSRDDAGKFLGAYYDKKIYESDPFARLDQVGVGKLVAMAAKLGRETRPEIHLGICGEHGGDPSSVEFCHKVGLDYVSCSPFRVPIARLAAAQAAIKEM